MTSPLVVLSGGMDSTTALALTMARIPDFGGEVRAVTFNYGQRHDREIDAARMIADHYAVPLRVVDLRGIIDPAVSSLTGGGDIPEGHYAEDNMASTVVHGRNLLFASAALSVAGPESTIVLGVHAGDHHVYPDCRPEFWASFSTLARTAYAVEVDTPLLHDTKADIAQKGRSLGAPLPLSWSCYKGGEVHCGRCGTCVERAEAFHLAGVTDPTEYADPDFWREAVR